MLAAFQINNARHNRPTNPVVFQSAGDTFRWDPMNDLMTLHHEHLDPITMEGEVQRLQTRLPLDHNIERFQRTIEQRSKKRGLQLVGSEAAKKSEPAPWIPVHMEFDALYRRAIAKIALLYAAHRYGSEKIRHANFDAVRSFVLSGHQIERRFVGIGMWEHSPIIFGGHPPQHRITIFEYCGALYSHVLLFGGLVHVVYLGSTVEPVGSYTTCLDPSTHQIVSEDDFDPAAVIGLTGSEASLRLYDDQEGTRMGLQIILETWSALKAQREQT